MIRFFRRSIPSPNDSVLKIFMNVNAAFPATLENPLVAVIGPAVSRLLVAKNVCDFIVIKDRSQGDFCRGRLKDHQLAPDPLEPC